MKLAFLPLLLASQAPISLIHLREPFYGQHKFFSWDEKQPRGSLTVCLFCMYTSPEMGHRGKS